jgi:flagellar basal-body rod protein FlgB
MTGIFTKDLMLRTVSSALDGLSLRQRAIASNIANVDTPGYKAKKVSFEEQLQQTINDSSTSSVALRTTHTNHINYNDLSGSILITESQTTFRNDGNNVDMDLEMTNLAETTIRYQTLTQLAGKKFTILKNIIRESR